MNKKLFIPLVLSSLLFASLSFRKGFNASYASDVVNFDVNAIQALSHRDGMTVNFVNDDLLEYWDSDSNDIDKLRTLYEMNTDIESFISNSFDHEYVRELYANWDSFKPVNNTLSWKSNVSASSYDIVVSLNPELTEALYEAKGLTETEYTMENPYASSHYFWQVTAHTKNGDVKSSIFDFYSGDHKRTVSIPSISNTRDIGGFTGEFGMMQQGLIYRSGRLDDLDESASEALRQLDIQTDLDLRKNGEGAKNPAHLTNYYLKTLLSYYQDFNEENRPNTIEAVRIFTNPDNYPVMFHCAVGRDRTGTLALLLQALCGASREYIVHDYYTSMWSVTGAYQKSLNDLNLTIVNDTLNALERFGDNLTDGAEKFLRQREDTITHELVGLTDDEITAIRDIWSGKTSVNHGFKTFKAEENYEGKTLVKIKALGHQEMAMMVTKGTVLSEPYQLDPSMMWMSEGRAFDFATPINEMTFIYADYVIQYVVAIHFAGIARQDEILRVNRGEVINFDKYNLDGFSMFAISDEGREITSFEATRDAYINIIYMRK